ncbi:MULTISPECIES: DUF4144 family protein [Pseudoalteromonas]|jgi:hypothetical protein|uniref:Uncharacterized protein n=1 Tax=Pseudoalteromonas lipolytica TaxID=570156 RepID=A0AAD0RXS3_9GAMM|nr:MULTISPECIES: DUF4144 family protein [Pseudoalteromonas]AXV64317.1 hypothetical protein D0907_03005 [Pseudoalteromonas donghaensis]EWH06666.1 hypothetical protein AT00_11015 [Pseudoalteromonas lipolytica SCSIO 04301]MAE02381.1 hypothetical protein [Pseudoalteromonas sp.]MBE0352011.1 hypothetical protein [Pseudoalteromonas lipolytica LMEB 39]MCC9661036.1 DUF4144 domain-containing protein [Pseudoalteromonas sp. MB41]|tara:strand:- start:10580 stop:10873 length:294 start_codon:yes stop_codon:yes gene_type:complete
MHQSFPLIICAQQELDYLKDESDLESFLFNLDENQKNQVILIAKNGQHFDLNNNQLAPLSDTDLAKRVTQHLTQEGICCLSKVTRLTTQQAFSLLES